MVEESLSSVAPAEGVGASNGLGFMLPVEMTIETVEAVVADLKPLLCGEEAGLTLDASQVEVITTPGLQLIVALEKTIAARGGKLVVNGKQDGFTRAFAEAGLDGLLK